MNRYGLLLVLIFTAAVGTKAIAAPAVPAPGPTAATATAGPVVGITADAGSAATVRHVVGGVSLGNSEAGQTTNIVPGALVQHNDAVTTTETGYATIELTDGSTVFVLPNSKVSFAKAQGEASLSPTLVSGRLVLSSKTKPLSASYLSISTALAAGTAAQPSVAVIEGLDNTARISILSGQATVRNTAFDGSGVPVPEGKVVYYNRAQAAPPTSPDALFGFETAALGGLVATARDLPALIATGSNIQNPTPTTPNALEEQRKALENLLAKLQAAATSTAAGQPVDEDDLRETLTQLAAKGAEIVGSLNSISGKVDGLGTSLGGSSNTASQVAEQLRQAIAAATAAGAQPATGSAPQPNPTPTPGPQTTPAAAPGTQAGTPTLAETVSKLKAELGRGTALLGQLRSAAPAPAPAPVPAPAAAPAPARVDTGAVTTALSNLTTAIGSMAPAASGAITGLDQAKAAVGAVQSAAAPAASPALADAIAKLNAALNAITGSGSPPSANPAADPKVKDAMTALTTAIAALAAAPAPNTAPAPTPAPANPTPPASSPSAFDTSLSDLQKLFETANAQADAITTNTSALTAAASELTGLRAQLATAQQAAATAGQSANSEKATLQQQINTLKAQVTSLQGALNTAITSLSAAGGAPNSPNPASQAIEQLKTELAAAKKLLEDLGQLAGSDMLERYDDLREQLEGLQRNAPNWEELQDIVKTQTERIVTLTNELNTARSERDALRSERDDAIARLQRELGQVRERMIGLSQLEQLLNERLTAGQRVGGEYILLTDRIRFASGSADVTTEARTSLQAIVDQIKRYMANDDYQILIEGRADERPLRGRAAENFGTNWELSAMRAVNITHVLLEQLGASANASKIIAMARGDADPLDGTAVRDDFLAQNRSVRVIVITRLENLRTPSTAGAPVATGLGTTGTPASPAPAGGNLLTGGAATTIPPRTPAGP